MPTTKRAKAPYRMVTRPTWELVRAAYLGGMTAQAVADRFGLGVHNVRRKIHDEGWSKRAYAEARQVTVDQGTPPAPRPKGRSRRTVPAPEETAAPDPHAPPPAVLNRVLERAREALVAGKGTDASALMRAAREYVILTQDIQEARRATEFGARSWAEHHPHTAEDVAEVLAMQALHDQWTRPDDAEVRRRHEAAMEWMRQRGMMGDGAEGG